MGIKLSGRVKYMPEEQKIEEEKEKQGEITLYEEDFYERQEFKQETIPYIVI